MSILDPGRAPSWMPRRGGFDMSVRICLLLFHPSSSLLDTFANHSRSSSLPAFGLRFQDRIGMSMSTLLGPSLSFVAFVIFLFSFSFSFSSVFFFSHSLVSSHVPHYHPGFSRQLGLRPLLTPAVVLPHSHSPSRSSPNPTTIVPFPSIPPQSKHTLACQCQLSPHRSYDFPSFSFLN